MSRSCCVPNCKNKQGTNDLSVSFFRLPDDVQMKIRWMVHVFGLVDFKYKDAYICSAHFKKDDFENIGLKMLNSSQNLVLKRNAVPTLNLPPKHHKNTTSNTAIVSNTGQSPVGIIIYQYNLQDSNIQNSIIQNNIIQTTNNHIPNSTKVINQKKVKDMLEEKLKNKINTLKADLRSEKHKCSLLQRKVAELRNKVEELHASAKELIDEDFEEKIIETVKRMSSNTQIDELLKTHKLRNADILKHMNFNLT